MPAWTDQGWRQNPPLAQECSTELPQQVMDFSNPLKKRYLPGHRHITMRSFDETGVFAHSAARRAWRQLSRPADSGPEEKNSDAIQLDPIAFSSCIDPSWADRRQP